MESRSRVNENPCSRKRRPVQYKNVTEKRPLASKALTQEHAALAFRHSLQGRLILQPYTAVSRRSPLGAGH